jgi:hypothetical protein
VPPTYLGIPVDLVQFNLPLLAGGFSTTCWCLALLLGPPGGRDSLDGAPTRPRVARAFVCSFCAIVVARVLVAALAYRLSL